jgi:hypothetical protein
MGRVSSSSRGWRRWRFSWTQHLARTRATSRTMNMNRNDDTKYRSPPQACPVSPRTSRTSRKNRARPGLSARVLRLPRPGGNGAYQAHDAVPHRHGDGLGLLRLNERGTTPANESIPNPHHRVRTTRPKRSITFPWLITSHQSHQLHPGYP